MNIANFRFELSNPFDRWEYFKPLGSINGRLFTNKAWELEHSFMSTMLIDTDFVWSHKTDHAGLSIMIGLLGYGVGFRIYDTRHWNSDTNNWEEYKFDEYPKVNS
jgi:hypothetical protein